MVEFEGAESHLVASDWFETKGQVLVAAALRVAPWAHAVSEDEFGVYADLRVGEAKQRLRYIMPGSFIMGSPETEEGRWDDEGPQHKVTFTKGFWMADTPCTQLLWSQVMGNNPSRDKSPWRPVEQVSWNDVQAFLGELQERALDLDARLPTEEEWEYACRAGTATARYGELDDIAWWRGNANRRTHEVAQKQANAWGLYDMLGNVWEWCANTWVSERVYRGGSWISQHPTIRAAYRFMIEPTKLGDALGFRFVIE